MNNRQQQPNCLICNGCVYTGTAAGATIIIKSERDIPTLDVDPDGYSTSCPDRSIIELLCSILKVPPTNTSSLFQEFQLQTTTPFCLSCKATLLNVSQLLEQIKQLEQQVEKSKSQLESQLTQSYINHVTGTATAPGSGTGSDESGSSNSLRTIEIDRNGGLVTIKHKCGRGRNISRGCSQVEVMREIIVEGIRQCLPTSTSTTVASPCIIECVNDESESVLGLDNDFFDEPMDSPLTTPEPAQAQARVSPVVKVSSSRLKSVKSRKVKADAVRNLRSRTLLIQECSIPLTPLKKELIPASYKGSKKIRAPRRKRDRKKKGTGGEEGAPKRDRSIKRVPKVKREKPTKPFTCPECPRIFKKQTSLNYHVTKCHTQTPLNHFCSNCGKRFYNESTLQTHVKVQGGVCKKNPLPDVASVITEPGRDQFKCNICNLTCHSTSRLRNHLVKHSKEKHFVCDLCGARYGLASSLSGHMRLAHCDPDKHPFRCEIPGCCCGKKFSTKQRFSEHQKLLRQEFDFLCTACDFKTVSSRLLKKHTESVHEEIRKYKCTHCASAFKKIDHLQRHIFALHTAPEDKPFKCAYCPRTFSNKMGMENHQITHTGEKPKECHICGRRFAIQVYLITHLKTHGVGKPRKSTGAAGGSGTNKKKLAGIEEVVVRPNSTALLGAMEMETVENEEQEF